LAAQREERARNNMDGMQAGGSGDGGGVVGGGGGRIPVCPAANVVVAGRSVGRRRRAVLTPRHFNFIHLYPSLIHVR